MDINNRHETDDEQVGQSPVKAQIGGKMKTEVDHLAQTTSSLHLHLEPSASSWPWRSSFASWAPREETEPAT